MKLTIDIDLNTDSREQIAMVANLLNNVTNAARRPSSGTQPQVVENSGSAGAGLRLSPVASTVTGVSIPADEAEPKDTPVVVKDAVRRTRAKKEEPVTVAVAQVSEHGQSVSASDATTTTEAAAVSTSESADAAKVPAAASTIDDVRAALQAFTAKNGVPAGIDLLKGFGAARISELKEADYAAFVEKCGV